MNKLKIPGILLLLSVLLSACQTGGPQLVADSQKSEYHLACKLAGESELKVSSPDLNKQFFLQSQQTDLSLPLVETSEDEDVTPPRDLEVSYANPKYGNKTRFRLLFDAERWWLDRAAVNMEFLSRKWLLQVDASLAPHDEAHGCGVLPLDIRTDMTSLLWSFEDRLQLQEGADQSRVLHAPQQFSVRQFSQATHMEPETVLDALRREGHEASLDTTIDMAVWSLVGKDLNVRVEALGERYRAFQKLTMGGNSGNVKRMTYSLGGFLPTPPGELIASYRLLHRSPDSLDLLDTDERYGYYEHAGALGFSGYRKGFLREVGQTVALYDLKHLPVDDSEENDEGYTLLSHRSHFAFGSELSQGFIDQYRIDVDVVTQRMLAYSELYAESSTTQPILESQLHLRTGIGTLFGLYRYSDINRKFSFGLEKLGQRDAQLKLYCEDVSSRDGTEDETIVGGKIDVKLCADLWRVFSVDYWRRAEKTLFPWIPLPGYTTPRQGHHIPTLDNDVPALDP